ncbi:hypothetical protein O6H91_03G045300 [Diphasiastrum complanatum]|uniref:Uncharacterized protein n=2 Tax=Diphasiastrum complanatum TaxID=34168 RepID=A0ACC2E4Q0_DIPCM|nr:hypothetical protein O6H91_03G032900 [Diphasiastrum complanatum]KAJ7561876.1 hypothetical protein O6H91_03G045300 [Diphasiastrum complanatum]
MSSSSSTVANSPASRGLPRSDHLEEAPHQTRSSRNERSAGKGRRRRTAAEERRIEQQRWVQYVGDDEIEDFAVAPTHVNRRRARRSLRRRNLGQDALDDYLSIDSIDEIIHHNEESSIHNALALALSLSDSASASQDSSNEFTAINMSYENLVLLEDVKIVAPPLVVSSFKVLLFEGTKNQTLPEDSSEVCAVCQNEYVIAENLIILPCCHNFHHECGSEWLLNHSKLCPICKHDVTE